MHRLPDQLVLGLGDLLLVRVEVEHDVPVEAELVEGGVSRGVLVLLRCEPDGEIDVALLDRVKAVGRVGERQDLDLVLWCSVPIGLRWRQDDLLAGSELREGVRPPAGGVVGQPLSRPRILLGRVLGDLDPVDRLRVRRGERGQHDRRGAFGDVAELVLAVGLDRLDAAVDRQDELADGVERHVAIVRVLHIGGGELVAVLVLDALAQEEGDLLVLHLPTLGEPGVHLGRVEHVPAEVPFVGLPLVVGQAFIRVVLDAEVLGISGRRTIGVDGRRDGLVTNDDRAGLGGSGGGRLGGIAGAVRAVRAVVAA